MEMGKMPCRPFGKTGLNVSVLSIGAMRLPADEEAVVMLRRAIDLGCNYIDASRGYGDCELKLAKALAEGYRKKVTLSTKDAPWIMPEPGYDTTADSTRRKIEEQMKRLQVDHLDFYQVWNIIDADTFAQAIAPGGMVAGIRQAIKEGIVDHIGATTHAPESVVLQMIDSGCFETITVSYNLLNTERQRVIEHAREKNVGIVVMNPFAGGILGYESAAIQNTLPQEHRSSREMALRFVIDCPGVSTAICGFTCLREVEENVTYAAALPLTADQRETMAQKVAQLQAKSSRFCTQCGYCMPCPQGVDIRGIFNLYNHLRFFGLNAWARQAYYNMKPETKADRCSRCQKCLPKCTNHLNIPEELANAHDLLK